MVAYCLCDMPLCLYRRIFPDKTSMCIFPTGENDCTLALFGDSFGVVNVLLISALAFAGMIVTFVLQRKELEVQRKEFFSQNETLRLQRFENTFFNMIDLQKVL